MQTRHPGRKDRRLMNHEEKKDWYYLIDKIDRMLNRFETVLERTALPPTPDQSLFERHIAFRWEKRMGNGFLYPIEHPHLFDLNDLVGVDEAKEEVVRNTAQFVAGYPANNVLLWGERGTGKSSCVKGLLVPFSPKGLRLIEVQKDDLLHISEILRLVRETPWRFILFCDDLSFEEGESSYRELKAILEGGIEARPENVLLYATSNRRHLMPESMNDNLGKEIHPEEAVSEKLSLADRFGLTLSFYSFSQDTYLAIAEHYAERMNLNISREELRKEALRWALFKGRRSGRSARQFIDDLAGRLGIGEENFPS